MSRSTSARGSETSSTSNDFQFQSGEHALAAGYILGALMKAAGEDAGGGIQDVRPFYDAQGNYTNQFMVTFLGDRVYTVTVDDALSEAMHDEEE